MRAMITYILRPQAWAHPVPLGYAPPRVRSAKIIRNLRARESLGNHTPRTFPIDNTRANVLPKGILECFASCHKPTQHTACTAHDYPSIKQAPGTAAANTHGLVYPM